LLWYNCSVSEEMRVLPALTVNRERVIGMDASLKMALDK
jgi:hypothetical protein